jgi:hypothetical protein
MRFLPCQADISWSKLTFRNPASYIKDGHIATSNTPHFLYFFKITRTEFFKYAAHSPFISLQNAVYPQHTLFFIIFSTNTRTEFFKYAAHSPFLSLQNAVYPQHTLFFIIFSTNTRTEFFKYAAHSPFLSLQNAVYFIMLPFLVPVLVTFYIQDVLKN